MHKRKAMRLKNYDYILTGFYFVTICTKDRDNFFGEVKNEEIKLNNYGKIVEECWYDLEKHYLNCRLVDLIIMPNHIHGIIEIDNSIIEKKESVGNGFKPFPTREDKPFPIENNELHGLEDYKLHGLSEIIRGFKTFSSRKINEKYQCDFRWQKSFYDHVIRDEKALIKIKEYIKNNPLQWELDEENIHR